MTEPNKNDLIEILTRIASVVSEEAGLLKKEYLDLFDKIVTRIRSEQPDFQIPADFKLNLKLKGKKLRKEIKNSSLREEKTDPITECCCKTSEEIENFSPTGRKNSDQDQTEQLKRFCSDFEKHFENLNFSYQRLTQAIERLLEKSN